MENMRLEAVTWDNFEEIDKWKLTSKEKKLVGTFQMDLARVYLNDIRRKDVCYRVIAVDSLVVGYITGCHIHEYKKIDINNIFIHMSVRKQGFAYSALREYMNYYSKEFERLDGFTCRIQKVNKPSIALFEKTGFQKTGYQESDDLLYALKLPNKRMQRTPLRGAH